MPAQVQVSVRRVVRVRNQLTLASYWCHIVHLKNYAVVNYSDARLPLPKVLKPTAQALVRASKWEGWPVMFTLLHAEQPSAKPAAHPDAITAKRFIK